MAMININSDEPGHFFLQGELIFPCIDKNTVKAFTDQLNDTTGKIKLDLNQVTSSDSAGLALLIEWLKFAENKNIKLLFDNIPEQLLALARLGGFEEALVTCKSHS